MENLKVIFASNLIRLRTAKGLTQAELGALLSYSDKSVSKWERAESLPDAQVLLSVAELFGVSVDYLLHSHDEWVSPDGPLFELPADFNPRMILWLSAVSICTLALTLFVIFWILGYFELFILFAAVPVAVATVLVMNILWGQRKYNMWIVMVLVLAVFLLVYYSLLSINPWQLFLLLLPAELIVVLAFNLRKRRAKSHENA